MFYFRFFLAFDKATGKTDNWPKDDSNGDKVIAKNTTKQKTNTIYIHTLKTYILIWIISIM